MPVRFGFTTMALDTPDIFIRLAQDVEARETLTEEDDRRREGQDQAGRGTSAPRPAWCAGRLSPAPSGC